MSQLSRVAEPTPLHGSSIARRATGLLALCMLLVAGMHASAEVADASRMEAAPHSQGVDSHGVLGGMSGGSSARPVAAPGGVIYRSYSFAEKFDIAETSNQQGLAFGGGFLWACFDTGGGNGKIIKYSMNGDVRKTSPDLPLGHCAEIAYRNADGTLYAVDYVSGASVARVRVVDMDRPTPAVVKTLDITRYGLAGMVTIDNARDQLVVFGGRSPYRFNFLALSKAKSHTTARWLREVTYRSSLGLPQGLEVVGDELLFMTSNAQNGSLTHNRIHVFDRNARYKSYINVPIARESQGLAVAGDNTLYFGLKRNNSVWVMSPAYQAVG